MITLFTIPKPFEGHFGRIQRNALWSWARIDANIQLVICGDEPGCGEIATELGADWLPEIARNEYGTPRLDDAFAKATALARHGLLGYVNADILLFDDLADAVRRVAMRRWLMIGQRIDLDVTGAVSTATPAESWAVRAWARREGSRHGCGGLDYFLWPRVAELSDLPPLAVGRPGWDNYFVWRARYERRLPLVDATDAILAVHQNHDYAHVPGGDGASYNGPEAAAQRAQLGPVRGSVFDATHVLTPTGMERAKGLAYRRARWKRRWWSRALLDAECFVGRTTHAPRRALRRAIAGFARSDEAAPRTPADSETPPHRSAA